MPDKQSFKRPVNVSVKDNQISLSPLRVKFTTTGDTVVWRCKGGDLEVRFDKDGTPFESGTYAAPEDTDCESSPCAPTAEERVYHYTLVVHRRPPLEPVTIDPEAYPDDGTPPPPRMAVRAPAARAAKKVAARRTAARKRPAKRKPARKKPAKPRKKSRRR